METEAIPIPRFLASLPLFHDLSTEELGRIAQGCQLRRLGRGEMVFRVGQPCDECHAVISGQVKLFAISPDGHEKVIELVGPGNCFAEAVMFLGRERPGPCLYLVVNGEQARHPGRNSA